MTNKEKTETVSSARLREIEKEKKGKEKKKPAPILTSKVGLSRLTDGESREVGQNKAQIKASVDGNSDQAPNGSQSLPIICYTSKNLIISLKDCIMERREKHLAI